MAFASRNCERRAWLMYIFRASRRTKDGGIIYAKDYGKRAFRIWIGPGPEPDKKAKSK